MIHAGGVQSRRPRADSERNRSEILNQAEKHFSNHGVNASLETVARSAGVGSATLYRHFPTRDDLLAELLQDRNTRLDGERARIKTLADSGAALNLWLAALESYFAAFDGLPEPLRNALLEEQNPLATTCYGFIEYTDEFLAAAQRDGKASPSVRGRDLFLAALAFSWVRGAALADDSSLHHLHDLIAEGYTANGGG
ncbi:TetR/AcrR family transcriptional regulator [Paenarthrobacter sp. AT5]|uniref:TetR/AcrR family transcriptional regulator n=1 Tax=Paenarthrobacter TaxID=1742992 RepID=UPI001A99C536|nr:MULTISPECIES: TetR/AcrR family transcriptional regulator [Paenarthrobacter]WOC60962.1 TetR/AcrR family transcriptional regulator [Paenarthrobacter sp. AT5]